MENCNFEKVSRLRLRFASDKGDLLSEDLWNLSLTDLNEMAKKLNRELACAEEEDFLNEGESEKDKRTRLKFETVIHVLKTKKAEAEEKDKATERKAKKEKLMEILDKKENAALENMSKAALRKMISEL
jgi:hypothetical protein